MQEYAIQRPPW